MPKLVSPLTDIQVKNAKPKDKPYKLSDGGGLYLLANPDGAKYWRMDYRILATRRTAAFGKYPQVSLSEARDKRTVARKLIEEGKDPVQAKQDAIRLEADSAANTFGKLALEWHTNMLPTWSSATAANIWRRLELDIIPVIGAMPIGSITHQHMIAALRKIEHRGAGDVANKTKQHCARVFSYANQQGIENRNPARDLKDVLKPIAGGHFAAITPDELPAFLAAMNKNDGRMFKPTRIALRLMMLVFVRTSELLETPWSEIDFETETWVIPWQRMKMGKRKVKPDKTDHHTCLSKQGWDLLRELHTMTGTGRYLFQGQRDHEKPMSNGAILMALKRMGYQNKMTGHGFRSLAMGVAKEKLGYRHEVPNRQLAHKSSDPLGEAYDRGTFLAERRKMMQEIADYYDTIAAGGNVIAGNFKRA
ncbi:MAG: integrase arm-type DNA-binding domain-containing protein [Pseudomonadota bacterium]